MKKKRKIIILIGVVLGFFLFSGFFIYLNNAYFPRQDVPTIKEGAIIAESWIRNFSENYPYYGRDLSLVDQKEISRGEYEYVFSFTTDSPELGIHENEIIVKTINTEVISAISNGIFDEITKKYLEKKATVEMYFILEEDEDHYSIVSVERIISSSIIEDMDRVLIEELLKGPNQEEASSGFVSLIERTTELISLKIEDGVAYVELTIGLDQQSDLGKEQIVRTLSQIAEVRQVRAPERVQVVTLEIEGVPEDFSFSRNLQEGSSGIDVRYLQVILNADPDTAVTQQGPGSPGQEVDSFSESTTRAVMAFQRKYADEILRPAGLILSNGIVDEYTRDKLNAILEESRWQ
jgi:hypothetical protein